MSSDVKWNLESLRKRVTSDQVDITPVRKSSRDNRRFPETKKQITETEKK